MSVVDCAFCDRTTAVTGDDVIVAGEAWLVEIHDDAAVPGWYVLRTRRHIETFSDLTDREAGELGVMIREVSAALIGGIGATHVYLLSLGERIRHIHFLVATRPTSAEPVAGLELLTRLRALRDPEEADAVGARLRAHLHQRDGAGPVAVQT